MKNSGHRTNASRKVPYGNLFKASFVTSAGLFLGIVPQLLVGISLFSAGVLVRGRRRAGARNAVGIGLMILGSALALGFGSGALIGSLTE